MLLLLDRESRSPLLTWTMDGSNNYRKERNDRALHVDEHVSILLCAAVSSQKN